MPRTTANSSGLPADAPITIAYMDQKFLDMEAKFTALLEEKVEAINSLQQKVRSLEDQLGKLHDNIDDNDAYERRDCLVLAGPVLPEVSTGEICSNHVVSLVSQKLQINIDPRDISVAHRLGPKRTSQGPDKRPIIAKLCRRDLKREVLQAARSRRATGFYVNESLTPARRTIFNALRKMRKSHPGIVKGVSTQDGKVFAFTKPINPMATDARDQKHWIKNQSCLVQFCRDFVKRPLDQFLIAQQ